MLRPRDVAIVSTASVGLFAAFALAISFIPIVDTSGETFAPAGSLGARPMLSPPPQEPEPLISDYADIKAEFDELVRGPLVFHDAIDGYGQRMPKEETVLLLAPGVELAEVGDRDAIKTVVIDLEVTPQGSGDRATAHPASLRDAQAWASLTPEQRLARKAPLLWSVEPFKRNGRPVRALIKNVPIRLLFGGNGHQGRIAHDAKNCRNYSLIRERAQASQGIGGPVPMAVHRAELTSEGDLKYEGGVGVVMRGSHTGKVSAIAVRETIGLLLRSSLLELTIEGRWEGGSGNPWSKIGNIEVVCDGRTLVRLPVTLARSNGGVTLDEQIAALGIDRYTTGTDETPLLLVASGWDFSLTDRTHIEVVRQLAKTLSAAGMLELVRLGAPLTTAQQTARNAKLPVSSIVAQAEPILSIVAARGRGDIVRELLAQKLSWSRTELSDALIAFVQFDDPATYKALLAEGADVNARDKHGATTLMMCPKPASAELLLQAGADFTVRNSQGMTLLELLRARPSCVETAEVVARWALTHKRPH